MKVSLTKKALIHIFLFIAIFFCLPFAFCQGSLVQTIYFKSNDFTIDKKYENVLGLIAKKLSSDTFGYLKIFGYADTNGSENHNEVLSEKRANAVYNYLASKVEFDSTKGYVTWLGESAEIYDLHFPEAHKQQRCVDIWVQFYNRKNRHKPK